ncbi:MAG: hypothetical protein ABWZ25_18745 [Chitinophagaceae bacterium]
MNLIEKPTQVLFLVLLSVQVGYSQRDDIERPSDVVLLQLDKQLRVESPLDRVAVTLSNNSKQLMVRLVIPYTLLNSGVPDDYRDPASLLPFELSMNIDPWQVQDYLTSANIFTSIATLTLNHTSRLVRVQYVPLPSGPDQDGDFNISMYIRFAGEDFNLGRRNSNAQYLLKISNLAVNRM